VKISGWGRYPVVDAQLLHPRSVEAVRALLMSHDSVIARGNGRAYGDSAINRMATISMLRLDHFLAFDDESGQLTAQAGVSLADMIETFLPRGWFPAITPGTKFVTLGGMIAADVHGKNHHRDGSLRECVDWIDVMGADGEISRCSRDCNAELFDSTLGGMGLTGIILQAAIRLRRVETGWIRQTTIPAANLRAVMASFEEASEATYSVAWIDCQSANEQLGRSVLILGEHASRADLPPETRETPLVLRKKRRLIVPLDLPSFALTSLSVRAFNVLYHRRHVRAAGVTLVDWDSYFYPLDSILGWNRIYGRRGFVQFQCVLPLEAAEQGLSEILETTARARAGSFLAVLKRLGPQESRFSFPTAGYTLAMDFPVSPKTFQLLEILDAITVRHGGRFYLAKDSRLSASTLRAADPRAEMFACMRRETGQATRFHSSQSERLSL
jgi:decaprenylphospho-beta-D-ribofuranose 2-oxidase